MEKLKVEHEQKANSEEIESKYDPNEDSQDNKSQYNSGTWTDKEQQLYIFFADFHRKQFKSKHVRKLGKIFKTMGLFVRTRDGVQCRSHHMKQLKTYGNVDYVIKHYKKNIGTTAYFERFENYKSDLARFPLQSLLPINLKPKKTFQSSGKAEKATQTEFQPVKIQSPPQVQLPSLSNSMIPMLQPQNLLYWNWYFQNSQPFPQNPKTQ